MCTKICVLNLFFLCGDRGVRSEHNLTSDDLLSSHDLAKVHIVLTTYDILREDLYHDVPIHMQHEARQLRYPKKHRVIPTPLSRLKWWRIIVDEAQMVESSTAKATEMAMRLHACHKW